jgi:hypothetical protein
MQPLDPTELDDDGNDNDEIIEDDESREDEDGKTTGIIHQGRSQDSKAEGQAKHDGEVLHILIREIIPQAVHFRKVQQCTHLGYLHFR